VLQRVGGFVRAMFLQLQNVLDYAAYTVSGIPIGLFPWIRWGSLGKKARKYGKNRIIKRFVIRLSGGLLHVQHDR
jgi:hypothetical protein